MKRNQRTEVVGDEKLQPVTEQILSSMGQQGSIIRKRLQVFYQQRALGNLSPGEEDREESS